MKKKSVFNRNEVSFIASLGVAMSLRQLAMVMVLPFLSIYGKSLNYSTPALIGIALGVYGLIQGIMQVPLGRLSDKIGRKYVITIGSLFLAAGLALGAIATNIYLLILARALQGMGAIAAVCFSWIGDNIVESKRNQAMSMVGIFNGMAAVIAFVGGPFLYKFMSVPSMFAGCAVLVFLSWIYIVIFVKRDHVEKVQGEKVNIDYIGLFKNKTFVKLASSAFLVSYLMVGVFYVVPQLLEKSVGADSMWKVFIPATLLGIIVMNISSKLSDQGKLSIVALSSFACIAIGGVFFFFETFPCVLIGTILFMSGYMSLNSILPGSVTKLSTKDTRGAVTGVYNTVQFLGSFVGGALTGVLWGINSNLPTVAILIASAVGCMIVIRLGTKDTVSMS